MRIVDAREYPEVDANGPYRMEQVGEMSASGIRGRNSMVFDIEGVFPKEGNQWKYGVETVKDFRDRGDLCVKNGKAYFKIRQHDEDDKMEPFWSFIPKEVGTAETAKSELKSLIGNTDFETVKPTKLLLKLLYHVCANDKDALILDFFSGSATTAHAVMQLNAEDGGNRRYIMVQIPEVCDENSAAFKAGYKNICEIGKERIRRAGTKIHNSQLIIHNEKTREQTTFKDSNYELPIMNYELDLGFRVFKLDTSNFKIWDSTPVPPDDLETLINRMNTMIDRVKPDRSDLDVVYEIMLKLGIPITESVTTIDISGKTAYCVRDDCLLIICLQEGIATEMVEQMAEYAPAQIILCENALIDDTAMSNAHYVLKDRGIDLKLV